MAAKKNTPAKKAPEAKPAPKAPAPAAKEPTTDPITDPIMLGKIETLETTVNELAEELKAQKAENAELKKLIKKAAKNDPSLLKPASKDKPLMKIDKKEYQLKFPRVNIPGTGDVTAEMVAEDKDLQKKIMTDLPSLMVEVE